MRNFEFCVNFYFFRFLSLLLFLCVLPLQSFSESLETYELGTGDTIQILVYDEDDLSLEAQLADSGILNYPFLGELRLAGLSVAEVEQLITKGLIGDYLVSPKVSVSVIKYRQFFINGEVERPGGFSFQPGLTVAKAISLAEGFTERANKKAIYIVSDKDQNSENRKRARLTTAVQPGDIITVEQSFF